MTSPSLKAAKEAAAKVAAMLVASGQLRPSDIENPRPKSNKPSDLFVEEVIINDAPRSARNFLTRSLTQEEISKMSGASVSTKGRYINSVELNSGKNFGDRPLRLQIQGLNQQDVKVAVGRIMHLIMEHTHRKIPPVSKSKGQKSYGSNHMEKQIQNNSSIVTMNIEEKPLTILREKVFLPLTEGVNPVELCARLLGDSGTNFQYIKEETGLSVVLRGIGSGYIEPETGQEAPENMHFYLEFPNQEQFNQAKELVVNLTQTVLSQIQEDQQRQSLGVSAVAVSQLHPTISSQVHQQTHLQIQPAATTISAQLHTTFPSQVFPDTQQILVQSGPPPLIQGVAPPPTQLNQILPQQTVTPLVHVTQSMLPPPSIVVSQTTAQGVSEAVATQNGTISQLISLPVVTSTTETPVISQQLVQTSAGPQLVQIPHGSQIISTPEGPRLLAVIPNTTTPTVVTQAPISTSLSSLHCSRTVNISQPPPPIDSSSHLVQNPYLEIEKPKHTSDQPVYGGPQVHTSSDIVYLQHTSGVEHPDVRSVSLTCASSAIHPQTFMSSSVQIPSHMETSVGPPAQSHVTFSQTSIMPPSTEYHPGNIVPQLTVPAFTSIVPDIQQQYSPEVVDSSNNNWNIEVFSGKNRTLGMGQDSSKPSDGKIGGAFTTNESRHSTSTTEFSQTSNSSSQLPWSQYPQVASEYTAHSFPKPPESYTDQNQLQSYGNTTDGG